MAFGYLHARVVTSLALLSPIVPATAQALGQVPHHEVFDEVTNFGGASNNKYVFCKGPDCPERTTKYIAQPAVRSVIPAHPLPDPKTTSPKKESRTEEELPPK